MDCLAFGYGPNLRPRLTYEAGNVSSLLMVVRDSERLFPGKMFTALLGVSASANLPRC